MSTTWTSIASGSSTVTTQQAAENARDDAQKIATGAAGATQTLSSGSTTLSALHYADAASASATAASGSATSAASEVALAAAQVTLGTAQTALASTQATNSAASATASAASLTSFQSIYHGATSTTPTSNVSTGDLWFDTSTGVDAMKVYNGSAWGAAYISAAGTLVASNNLSDVSNAGTSRTNLGLGSIATQAASSVIAAVSTPTDNAVPRFDGTGGAAVQNSAVIIDDSNNVAGVVGLTASGVGSFGGGVNALYNAVGGSASLAVTGSSSSTNIVGNTVSSIAIVNTDDTTDNTAGLHFAWQDADGTPNYAGASIVAVLGEKTAGQYPTGDLHFLTSTTANAAPSTKLTILKSGLATFAGAVTLGGTLTFADGSAQTSAGASTGKAIAMAMVFG